MAGTRVLVTGAAGFIGSHIVRRLLARECEVTALVRPGSEPARLDDIRSHIQIVEADIHGGAALDSVLQSAAPNFLIHAAWHAAPGAYLTDPGNLDDLSGSLDLFVRAVSVGCQRIVGLGTCVEYDTTRGLLSESTPLQPTTLYAASKAALYLAADAWARQSGVGFAWTRVFYQYGPGEDPRRLVPAVITALLDNRPIAVTSGTQVRDYLHVTDVADAIVTVALSAVEGVVNIGSGHPIVVRDVVRSLVQQIGRAELVEFGARPDTPNDPPFICADVARLRREVHWQPSMTLEQGLEQTVDWWRQQRFALLEAC